MPLIRPMALTAALIFAASSAFAQSTLVVRGEGEASAPPDLVTIRIGVDSRAETAQEALAHNTAEATGIVEAAKARGVAPADIQTAGLFLSPVYASQRSYSLSSGEGEAPKLVGFAAGNELTIRLRNVAATGETIGALVGAGANRLNGIVFGVADGRAQMDEARREAVADAQRKAALYAEEMGVTLGPIIGMEEEGGSVQPRMMARAMSESYDVPIELGETSVQVAVRVVWSISPAE